MKLSFGRSFGAIFVGFFAMAGLSTIGRLIVLKFLTASDPNNLTALTSMQSILLWINNALSGCVAGYLVASLAGTKRMAHAMVLAFVILGFGVMFLITNMATAPLSTYTYVALIALPLGILIGGWVRNMKNETVPS